MDHQPCTLDDFYAKISEIDVKIDAKLQRNEELEKELEQAREALDLAERRKQEAVAQVARDGKTKATTTALDKAVQEVEAGKKHLDEAERMLAVIKADLNELRFEVFQVEQQSTSRYRAVLTEVRTQAMQRVREVEDAAWLAWRASRELGDYKSFQSFVPSLFPLINNYDVDAQIYVRSGGDMPVPQLPADLPRIPEAPQSRHLNSSDRAEMEVHRADT